MNDGERTAALSPHQGDDLTGQFWALEEFTTDEDRSITDLTAGITSVGYIRAALRRDRRIWCATALIGLLIGFGAFREFPPSNQASTSILLASNLPGSPGEAVQDDAAIAQSRAVAAEALRNLGLHQSAASFTANYTAAPLTNRVFVITVKATSTQAAIREANGVAAAFLTFQKKLLYAQQKTVDTAVQQQIAQAQRHLNALNQQISRLSAPTALPAQRAKLGSLASERRQASSALTVLKQAGQNNDAATKVENATLVTQTQVLDRAVGLAQHAKRYLVLYVGGGLIAGLVLGLFIVVIRALVSDKLRRRDDVARTLGAPVKLSVGQIRLDRGSGSPQRLEAAQGKGTKVRRIVAHLEREVPPSWGGLASLALVPADDVQVPALCLVSLALSCARRGFQVVLADLCSGSPAARLLGVAEPGVQRVSMQDAHVVVAVTDPDDVAPVGPLGNRSRWAEVDEALADACASADLLFTLAALDPAVGAGHLPGWARGAVATVTAGMSSAERIQAVGEMIRLAGMELNSAILIGADKDDESLGVTTPSSPPVTVNSALS